MVKNGGQQGLNPGEGRIVPMTDDGQAIKSIQKPIPVLALNKAQQDLVEICEQRWIALTYWLIWEQFRNVNIHRYPYTLPEFQAEETYAIFLSKLLDLCAGCWRYNQSIHDANDTPHFLWTKVTRELKQGEIRAIFEPPRFKRAFVEQKRELLQALKSAKGPEDLPWSDAPEWQHTEALLKTAIVLAKISVPDSDPKNKKKQKSFKKSTGNHS